MLQFIKDRRRELGFSCREFALELKLKPSQWNRIERGVEQFPQGNDFLLKLTNALAIEDGSEEWAWFVEQWQNHVIRERHPLTEAEVVSKLPLVFRKDDGSAMAKSELLRLAERLRTELA